MKRIIREVITLVRIERWLVQDEMPLTNDVDPETEHQTQELIIDAQTSATDDLRVIAQRVLESQQWELSPDGLFPPKRLHSDSQMQKGGE